MQKIVTVGIDFDPHASSIEYQMCNRVRFVLKQLSPAIQVNLQIFLLLYTFRGIDYVPALVQEV